PHGVTLNHAQVLNDSLIRDGFDIGDDHLVLLVLDGAPVPRKWPLYSAYTLNRHHESALAAADHRKDAVTSREPVPIDKQVWVAVAAGAKIETLRGARGGPHRIRDPAPLRITGGRFQPNPTTRLNAI
ncbi:MAG TPA: hypothetical protein QF901_15895, partial [Gammaproteobacteria bacterium]|nr:hypothetical protein [Gammaproteobacteria bacterium]